MKTLLLTFIFLSLSAQAGTLSMVKKRGKLKCGVSTGLAGFSAPDSKGNWVGMDVDFCRAVAAAIFNNPNKVQYVSLNAQQRFTALQSGEIDLLSRNTTLNLSRDTQMGINFGHVFFYDGQGFMVRKKLGVKFARELNGASVCTQQGTTTELNMADYFRANKLKLKPVVFESNEEVNQAFIKGRCDALTTDRSGLASERSKMKKPSEFVILPEVISKEPLAPAVRHGDDQWLDIITWTLYSLIEAEELGINQKNINKFTTSKNPRVRRFLGVVQGNGRALGLKQKWAFNVIKHMGNYGEIFERHVGKESPLKLSRGLNAIWTEGGLMYAPPVR